MPGISLFIIYNWYICFASESDVNQGTNFCSIISGFRFSMKYATYESNNHWSGVASQMHAPWHLNVTYWNTIGDQHGQTWCIQSKTKIKLFQQNILSSPMFLKVGSERIKNVETFKMGCPELKRALKVKSLKLFCSFLKTISFNNLVFRMWE